MIDRYIKNQLNFLGDILKIFYMYGDIWKDGFVKLDLRNAKMFGSRYDKCLTAIVYRGTRVIGAGFET